MIKEVNSNKFSVLYNKRIDLKRCKSCLSLDAEIKLPIKYYGNFSGTVSIECKNCGYKTGHHNVKTTLVNTDTNTVATVTLKQSLVKAIYDAIEEWNS